MKKIQPTRGKCKYCGKTHGFKGMIKHMESCEVRGTRLVEKQEIQYFTVGITSVETPLYWLIVELPESAKLFDLDVFLRDIWCECCGHMSSFTIRGETYEPEPEMSRMMGLEAKSIFIPVNKIFYPDLSFSYTYDFGDSTQLDLTVLSVRQGAKRGRKDPKVMILSRNNPPALTCGVCGKTATQVDSSLRFGYFWQDPEQAESPFFCDACIKKYGDADMALPVCNSPRLGVCAYEGSHEYPDEFEPDD